MKRSVRTGLVTAAVLTAATGWLLANEMAPSRVGLPIGTRAPDFALVDQLGRTRDLESLLSRGKLALVFYRSADW